MFPAQTVHRRFSLTAWASSATVLREGYIGRYWMTAETTTHGTHNAGIRKWLDGDLIALLAWLPVLLFAKKSALILPVASALTLCFGLAWTAFRGQYLEKWPRSMAWRLRIGAAVIGGWLFLVTPTLAGRIAAVTLYAILYIVCERAVWRRFRAEEIAQPG
jgi:hypothetical protein